MYEFGKLKGHKASSIKNDVIHVSLNDYANLIVVKYNRVKAYNDVHIIKNVSVYPISFYKELN